jgi:type I restriction enzyme M protein
MALKKSDLYSSLWKSCDELRGAMDASQYKDYILTLLFVKYVTDKANSNPDSLIEVPGGGSFDDLLALKGKADIGEKMNKVIEKLAEANELQKVITVADFNEEAKLGVGKEMVDRLSKLVTIFNDLDFRGSRAEGDDLLGDAYEYLMRHFATEAGKSKGQFYTPAEVSRILSKIVGIGPDTKRSQTVFDPTCGSGSLLIKAAAEAPYGITIYGQEKDNATWALCKMNMILHANATAMIKLGDTITNPQFTTGGQLDTFDFIVMNPPFSNKSWTSGLENEYGRFTYGRPPEKNGDYAFLLHVLKSLKSTGKAAIILPHGVLFRGNAEGAIRRELLRRGYIKGVIGLPGNLFYGTGIPACIVVLDKENAQARKGVFMIDASKGFMKDSNKNRLRSQDIHKIVDVFNKQIEVDRYSRMVPMHEISSDANNYNLNIPRYIDSSDPEDLQDLEAHIHGGIPERDIDALKPYWDAFLQLRTTLFKPNRPGYVDLAIDPSHVQQAILDSAVFKAFTSSIHSQADSWFEAHRAELETIKHDTRPNDLIADLGDDLLTRFKPTSLLDEYDVYEQLMSYWHSTVHDDVFLIMNEGWSGASKPRKTIEDKERKLTETPDLVIGSGRSAAKYKMDLIPPSLIVAHYFAADQAKVDELNLAVEEASRAVQEYIEEHAVEEGLLEEAIGDNGKVTKASASTRLKLARYERAELEEIQALRHVIDLFNAESVAKVTAKEAQEVLDVATLKQYGKLTEDEVKTLVITDKWQATIIRRVLSQTDFLTLALVARIQELGSRYAETFSALIDDSAEYEGRITRHLASMGIQ